MASLIAKAGRWQRLRAAMRGQRGSLLFETVLVVAVFTMLGTAVLTGMQTSLVSKNRFEAHSVTENLIRNQMAYVLEQPYVLPGGSYAVVAAPAGYTVTVEAVQFDANPGVTDISRVEVSVYRDGVPQRTVETVRAQ
ncbi:MAG: type II secretion system protein [SAR202 cluster bacterium]|nr:type II secretion system protein [SAR202 cluster bacterium]